MCEVISVHLLSINKRKFDVLEDDARDEELFAAKMIKHGYQPNPNPNPNPNVLHFFVRTIFNGKNVALHLDCSYSVESLHDLLRRLTGVPITDQCLVYAGKQLQLERTLAECGIQNDACLQLVGRMRSTSQPLAWQLAEDISFAIKAMLSGSHNASPAHLRSCVNRFISATPDDAYKAQGHLHVFNLASAPSALVTLLSASPHEEFSDCAKECIRLFLSPKLLPECLQHYCAPILMNFCKLLHGMVPHLHLYKECRTSLGSFLESTGNGPECHLQGYHLFDLVQELYPFVAELGAPVLAAMSSFKLSTMEIQDFIRFSPPLRRAIVDLCQSHIPIAVGKNLLPKSSEVKKYHKLYLDLLVEADSCLQRLELSAGKEEHLLDSETTPSEWDSYLLILGELNAIGRIYEGGEEQVTTILSSRRVALNFMVKHSFRAQDHIWLLHHKQVTDFESRRRLVLILFPEIKEEFDNVFEMLIDRNNLLADSFEYIRGAGTDHLQGSLFVEFKNEEATGHGVMREWFFLVCQAMFNPQNALFLSSPNDCRKFFPNTASGVNRLHLEYFGFCGRILALALMHQMQVGIMFDRLFFLQLAGKSITLDDIQDADPVFYKSCKDILEYNPAFVDSDALGLTFVRISEELGLRKVVELCPGGERIAVDSKNREFFVKLLIEHRFVTSVSRQISRFTQGFSDIISSHNLQKLFFQSLDLEDFNVMLYGSEKDICVKEWMAHTEYDGYKSMDCQIQWFWEVVENMSSEQKRLLLYFWTSINYLPYDGFRGLGSNLCIVKDLAAVDRLPSSHTCFYRLCLPPYPSIYAMQERLSVITQECMSRSFGTW